MVLVIATLNNLQFYPEIEKDWFQMKTWPKNRTVFLLQLIDRKETILFIYFNSDLILFLKEYI